MIYTACQHCGRAAIVEFADSWEDAATLESHVQICAPVLKHDSSLRFSEGKDIPIGVTLSVVTPPLRYQIVRSRDNALMTEITLEMWDQSYTLEVSTDSWTHDNGFRKMILQRGYQLFVARLNAAYVYKGGA